MTEYRTKIDKWALDIECERQVDLRDQCGKELVAAREDAAAASAALALVQAQLTQLARHSPEAFNLPGNPTVEAVRTAVVADQEYQQALERHQLAEARVNLLRAVDQTLDDRRDMLKLLVQLHGRDYFAAPGHDPGDMAKVRDATLTNVANNAGLRRRRAQG